MSKFTDWVKEYKDGKQIPNTMTEWLQAAYEAGRAEGERESQASQSPATQ